MCSTARIKWIQFTCLPSNAFTSVKQIPDINLDDNVKLQCLHYLLRFLIPFVKQFSKEQNAELLMEAEARGNHLKK